MSERKDHSLVYLGLVFVATAVAISFIHFVQTPYTDSTHGHGTFVAKVFASPPNEIGDTLAGIFGSLAFMAAAIALILQSFELKAQREELRLTRGVMEDQSRATQDMADALQAQAEAAEDEKLSRIEERLARHMEALMSQAFSRVLNFINETGYNRVKDKKSVYELLFAAECLTFEEITAESFGIMCRSIRDYGGTFLRQPLLLSDQDVKRLLTNIDEVLPYLDKMCLLEDGLAPAERTYFEGYRVTEAVNVLNLLVADFEENEKKS